MNICRIGQNIHSEKEGVDMSGRDLSEYVRKIMKLKGLTQKDVQRLSGGRITDGYVASISIGRANNPSVDKLKALADGLGVDADDLFHVACGRPERPDEKRSSPGADLVMILEILQKAVMTPDMIEIMHEILLLSPEERDASLRKLRKRGAMNRKSRTKTKRT
jgi:transcriptional regulator with XRE-family HTH domain